MTAVAVMFAATFVPRTRQPAFSRLWQQLESGGHETPDLVIASDLLPSARGRVGRAARKNLNALRRVLERSGWTGGTRPVGHHRCDEASLREGRWDPGPWGANGRG